MLSRPPSGLLFVHCLWGPLGPCAENEGPEPPSRCRWTDRMPRGSRTMSRLRLLRPPMPVRRLMDYFHAPPRCPEASFSCLSMVRSPAGIHYMICRLARPPLLFLCLSTPRIHCTPCLYLRIVIIIILRRTPPRRHALAQGRQPDLRRLRDAACYHGPGSHRRSAASYFGCTSVSFPVSLADFPPRPSSTC